jgi:hypothetical protein
VRFDTRPGIAHALTVARRVEGTLPAVRRWASRPRTRRILLVVAFAAFAILAIIAFRNLPDGVELRPLFMVLIALTTPGAWFFHAAEYRAVARSAGHRVGFDTALQVSVAVNLANLLPAPGGVAVKTAALKLEGSSLGSALSVNAIAGIVWIGATGVLVGLALLTDPAFVVGGLVVAAVGAVILLASALALRRRGGAWRATFVELWAIETGSTGVAAINVALGFAALGQSASIATAATIASAQVISMAISIFPAALGLREALSGALATAVNAPAAVAVASVVVVRASSLAGRVLLVPAVGLYLRKASRRQTPSPGSPASGVGEAQAAGEMGTTLAARGTDTAPGPTGDSAGTERP